MDMESVTLKLPRELLSGAQRVATARDVTIGHMVRQLLKREVERQMQAGAVGCVDGRLLTALQALLARDFEKASDWTDLTERLRMHGYELRAAEGGLVLFKSSCGTLVCRASEIGFADDTLSERFGGPMSGQLNEKCHAGEMPAGRLDAIRAGRISAHITQAQSWIDLKERLAAEGLELRAMGAGLGIYNRATGRHLCNTATVGARYMSLVRRFGAAMLDHPHDMSRHLPKAADSETGDEIEVIENARGEASA